LPTTGHFLTQAVTRVELICEGQLVGVATGFYLKHATQWYLVTNWHVLAGRDHVSGQPTRADGAVPTAIRIFRVELTPSALEWKPSVCELGSISLETALWFQHPNFGQDADLAVLPVNQEAVGKAKNILDPTGHDESMWIDLGQEVFLPGYPLGLTGGGLFPIWKRASIASSLEWGEGVKTRFLVDTATRQGMSGAPCFAFGRPHYHSIDRATNKMTRIERPLAWRWLGVYSGRRNPSDGFEAQLGVVWREGLVFETIEARQPAKLVLR
jgi:hypothetical protein